MSAKTASEILGDVELSHVRIESRGISQDAVYQITRVLYDDTGYLIGELDYTENIGLEFINGHGKIGKRIRALWHDRKSGTPSDTVLSSISSLYLSAARGIQCMVDLTDSFDWDDGQFGHDGSCYWDTYTNERGAHSRDTIEAGGGYALRFYRNDVDESDYDDDDGIGRTWILPVEHGRVIMLFNHYGELGLDKSADILQELFMDLKDWTTLNHVDVHYEVDYPYINSRKCTLLISPDMSITSIRMPFHPSITPVLDGRYFIDMGGEVYVCEACNRPIPDDDVHYNRDGESYCERCYDRLYTACDNCGEELSREDSISIGYRTYCIECIYDVASECSECGEWIDNDEITIIDDEPFCNDCVRSSFTYCDTCKAYVPDADYNNVAKMCNECLKDLSPNDFVLYHSSVEVENGINSFQFIVVTDVRNINRVPENAIYCPHCDNAYASILYSMAYNHIEGCENTITRVPIGQLSLLGDGCYCTE